MKCLDFVLVNAVVVFVLVIAIVAVSLHQMSEDAESATGRN